MSVDVAWPAPLADKLEIKYLLESWGVLRDGGHFAELRETYAPNALMHTSSVSGPAEEFVRKAEKTGISPGVTQHVVGGCHVAVKGDRALAETRMTVFTRRTSDEIPVNLTAISRMFDKLIRIHSGWRILERFPLYEKELVEPVDPGVRLKLDMTGLDDIPPALRYQAIIRRAEGRQIPAHLLKTHGAAFDRMYGEWRTWLTDGNNAG